MSVTDGIIQPSPEVLLCIEVLENLEKGDYNVNGLFYLLYFSGEFLINMPSTFMKNLKIEKKKS